MVTEVVMERKLFDMPISQKSKSEFFSATDLVRAGNRWRISEGLDPFDMSNWFLQKKVKEFIDALEAKCGKVKISGRGRGKHTWVHPFLFIDMALAISPKLKIEVYSWLYDHLIKYRNESGDSYKKMVGSIYIAIKNKSEYKNFIIETASRIKHAVGVVDWQKADEKQLQMRDKIHENIALLSDVVRDVDTAVRVGIKKVVEGK